MEKEKKRNKYRETTNREIKKEIEKTEKRGGERKN